MLKNDLFKIYSICLLVFLLIVSCQKTNTYYVDNRNGDNSKNGLSKRKAWSNLDNIKGIRFQPGDNILFRGGQTFTGTIVLDSVNGNNEEYIAISSFGMGKATINPGNRSGLIAENCSFLHVHDINFIGSGRKNGNTTSGLILQNGNNFIIDSVRVSGFLKSGIYVKDAQDVKLTHIHAFENGLAGIHAGAVYYEPFQLLSKNIYIGYCTTENNPGDPTVLNNHSGSGIIVSGTDGAVIEYCLAKNNGWDQPWEGNGPIGIWAFHSNNVLIQNCISHSNKSNPNGWDGGGFDFDGGITNSIMQYNYSYNNVGPGYGLYQYWGAVPWENNILRYNISINDGLENDSCALHLWNGQPDKPTVKNAYIYNNLFINDFGRAVDYKTGDIPGLYYWNNIFVSAQEPIYGFHTKSVFDNNLYWKYGKEIKNRNEDLNGIFADPLLKLPKDGFVPLEDPTKLKDLEFFQLLKNSPALDKGKYINENGEKDFWGNPMPTKESKLNLGIRQGENN